MPNSIKSLFFKYILFVLVVAFITCISCNFDEPDESICNFNISAWCGGGFSFSIVNLDTYENLIGDDKLIKPNKIVVTNTREDIMTIRLNPFMDGWYTVERFNPFDEIYCFDMCLSDSAFTRTYYLNYGGDDIDTMQVYFPERDDTPIVTFNNISAVVPEDRHDSTGLGYSEFWFRKKIK